MEAKRANGQPSIRTGSLRGRRAYQVQGNDREEHASESAPYLIAPPASFLRLCLQPEPRRSCIQCLPDAPSAGWPVMRRSAAGLRSRAAGSRSKIGAQG